MSISTQDHLNSTITLKKFPFDLFYPLRRWVDSIEVTNDKFAHFLCNLIP
ncbi:MAG: Mo-dependent nitrogenase C-terminal domain-containing protein [Xenococcaceae cyanobacterium MO_234.B1]|nr:Mo-dependent nitrogenase C-terminal domain-containing protein [Xenococcaceae cyanobacterium MO_234.B1]